jgi:hypothetical protein
MESSGVASERGRVYRVSTMDARHLSGVSAEVSQTIGERPERVLE